MEGYAFQVSHSCVCSENKWECRVERRTLLKEVVTVDQICDQGGGSGNGEEMELLTER